jgi:hypothetical protein
MNLVYFYLFPARCRTHLKENLAMPNAKVTRGILCFLLPLLILSCLTVSAGGKKDKNTNQDLSKAPFPDTVLAKLDRGDRFRNADYFKLMAADGIKDADPKAIFARMTAAAALGENYKALYFARLFTQMKPDLPAGWTNRAKLAAALGYADEAVACQVHAETPTSSAPVPLGTLPGQGLKVHPRDLADWAGAMALLSDSIAAKEGASALVSFKDSISGVKIITPQEEIARMGNDLEPETKRFMLAQGPYARSNPPLLDDVAANSFSLQAATPMLRKSSQGMGAGGFFTALMLGAAAGVATQNGDAATATQASNAAGQLAGEKSVVASEYSGGFFSGVTYTNGAPVVTSYKPQPAGASEAIGWPRPLLWASGGSLTSSFYAESICSSKDKVYCWTHYIRPQDLGDKKKRRQHLDGPIPALYYPKVARLCSSPNGCSIELTLMEVLLNPEDTLALAPGKSITGFNMADRDAQYRSGTLSLVPFIIGFDKDGVQYSPRNGPNSWLLSVGNAAPKH